LNRRRSSACCAPRPLGPRRQGRRQPYSSPESLERLAAIAGDLAAQSPEGISTAAGFRDRSGVGRNLMIALFEYPDKMGATRRVGDARVVRHGGEVTG
jgi:selenocysteine-specific elongation factor